MTQPVPPSRYWCFSIIAVMALTWDLASKSWVFSEIGYPHRSSDWHWSSRFLWGKLSVKLTTSFNPGALWGIGQGYSWLFATLSIVAALLVLYWLFIRGEARSWWMTICLSLIMAGTLGNLYDRLHLHGCELADGRPVYGVRDFLDFTIPGVRLKPLGLVPRYEWPIFNFADTYLVTGAIMLTIHSFRAPEGIKQAGKIESAESSAAAESELPQG